MRLNEDELLFELKLILLSAKRQLRQWPEEYDGSIDIRLCVESDGTWIFRTGLSDYDQRHSPYCGASCMTLETDASELLAELLEQIREQIGGEL